MRGDLLDREPLVLDRGSLLDNRRWTADQTLGEGENRVPIIECDHVGQLLENFIFIKGVIDGRRHFCKGRLSLFRGRGERRGNGCRWLDHDLLGEILVSPPNNASLGRRLLSSAARNLGAPMDISLSPAGSPPCD